MKPLRLYILPALAWLAASCSSIEEPDMTSTDDAADGSSAPNYCELIVELQAGAPRQQAAGSRADSPWSDPYPEEEGTATENTIDHVDLYVVLASGRVIAMAPERISTDGGVCVYKFAVSMDADYVLTGADGYKYLNGRIVALANYPGDTPASPLEAATYPVSSITQSGGLIPMWGVTSLSNTRLEKGASVNIGAIELLRSVAKVSIDLADDIKATHKITSVVASSADYAATANCTPAGAATARRTSSLLIEGCFNPAAESTTAPLGGVRGLNTQSISFYAAERTLPTVSGRPLYYTVTLERTDGSGAPLQGRVYLCDYADLRPDFDSPLTRLVRNHDYRYVIQLAELEFKISLTKWTFGGKVHIELE